jgi:pyrroline-5-carboxylate reductase
MGRNIGFIGTGAITSALVTGFSSCQDLDHKIYLSPRNAKRAAELAGKFSNVTVASSNQQVLDKSEWVILAAVPQFSEEIIRPLAFRADHCVISLMSDRKLPEIAGWIGKTRTLVHMLPLPFAANRIGPIAICPYDRQVADLFDSLGEIVGVDDVKQFEVLFAITAFMSAYNTLLWNIVQWGEGEGLTRKDSFNYTTAFFEALSIQARRAGNENLGELVREMTPGGLNEMAVLAIREQGGFETWIKALDPVLARLRK